MKHLDLHNILLDNQHGFHKKWSCERQLILTIQDLASGLEDGEQIDAILLDFSKAFDKVPHQRLLLKLQHYGIRGQLLSWIESFLTGRSQKVLVEGKTSIIICSCRIWSSSGHCSWPDPIPHLHQWPPEDVTLTTRLFADDSLLYRRSPHTTGRPQSSRDLGKRQADVLQPAEVWGHQDQQIEDSDNWLLYHPWSPTRHCQIREVPWRHPYRQPLMECPCRPSYKEGQ